MYVMVQILKLIRYQAGNKCLSSHKKLQTIVYKNYVVTEYFSLMKSQTEERGK